jgi:hypothetical protein
MAIKLEVEASEQVLFLLYIRPLWFTLQRHCSENLKQIFPEMKHRGTHPCTCEQFIYYHDQPAYFAAVK